MQVAGLTGIWVQADQGGAKPDPSSPGRQDGRGPAKIAAIGVKVDASGISRHGFALNVNPDMAYWEGIIGCGLLDHRVTHLAELLDPPPTMDKVMQAMISSFGDIYKYKMSEEPLKIASDFV